MIHWLWAFLAFVVGEFVGLIAFVSIFQDKETPPKKKWWNNSKASKKEDLFHD